MQQFLKRKFLLCFIDCLPDLSASKSHAGSWKGEDGWKMCYVRCACSLSMSGCIQPLSASPHKLKHALLIYSLSLKAISISVLLTIWKSCYLHQYFNSCIGAKEGETSGHLGLDVRIGVYVVVDIGTKRKKMYLSSTFLEGVWKYQIKFTGVSLRTCQAQSYMVQELMWQELQGHNLGHSSAAPRGLAPHYSNFIIPIKEIIS